MSTIEQLPSLPTIVRDAYEIDDNADITRLSGGQVNETLLVDSGEQKSILRRLAPMLGANMLQDAHVVSSHLANAGWEAPTLQPTREGSSHVIDESGRLWHGMPHIASDGATPAAYNQQLAADAGAMLGDWHRTMRSLDYTPRFSLPHFHDTPFIARKTQQELPFLPGQHTRHLAQALLDDYASQPKILKTNDQQIIHGDPKLDNMLFRDGRPFTLIDFDTVMRDTVWTDVGDFLRSLTGRLIDSAELESTTDSFLDSYHEASASRLSRDETKYRALHATRRIAGELGMRYLSDIVDGESYFTWDQRKYATRPEALAEKAHIQYKVVQRVIDQLNETR